ncbi:hypothetical protein MJG53_003825 [Ovis ammon polii x Ovis aries]|uniref:Uncharacterized protein n=1 Tax=Ovis ammon polii x Ovis aries TaxID=2918886 RepID=A0ACB9V892_9CETA|nr:hypothetical protein MJG53_003825 [Ovis ammon polii x Ovis aries]
MSDISASVSVRALRFQSGGIKMRKYSITSEIIRKAVSGTGDKFGKDSEVLFSSPTCGGCLSDVTSTRVTGMDAVHTVLVKERWRLWSTQHGEDVSQSGLAVRCSPCLRWLLGLQKAGSGACPSLCLKNQNNIKSRKKDWSLLITLTKCLVCIRYALSVTAAVVTIAVIIIIIIAYLGCDQKPADATNTTTLTIVLAATVPKGSSHFTTQSLGVYEHSPLRPSACTVPPLVEYDYPGLSPSKEAAHASIGKGKDLNEMIAHESIGGLKEGNGGHQAAKDCQLQEDSGSSRTKRTREDAVFPGPCGIRCSGELPLRRESPKVWASREEVLESGRIREAMPPPTLQSPAVPPTVQTHRSQQQRSQSQSGQGGHEFLWWCPLPVFEAGALESSSGDRARGPPVQLLVSASSVPSPAAARLFLQRIQVPDPWAFRTYREPAVSEENPVTLVFLDAFQKVSNAVEKLLTCPPGFLSSLLDVVSESSSVPDAPDHAA